MAGFDYDLFVIGGGSGGVRAARLSAGLGKKVALAEQSRLGGTCVIRGCVPKKLYVYAARFADDFALAPRFGWSLTVDGFDWPSLVAAKNAEIARLEGMYRQGQEKAGVQLFDCRAVLEDAHQVRLADGQRVSAETVLIATGSASRRRFDWPGADLCISSDEAFDLPELPKAIAIAGGGYIAVEFAHIFALLGCKVTVVYRGPKLLRSFDADMRDAVMAGMAARGIEVLTNSDIAAVSRAHGGLQVTTSSGVMVSADQVMLALGRDPNTEGLGLERAGVAVGEDGRVLVDGFGRSAADHIFAVGDVTGLSGLTPVAIRDAHAFVATRFANAPTAYDHHLIPTAVFASPEIATVGLSEEAALAAGHAIDVYMSNFKPMKYSFADHAPRMVMKMVVDAADQTVLGVHIAGPDAAEMIQLCTVALKMKAKKTDFDAAIALHPCAAEELVTMRSKAYARS